MRSRRRTRPRRAVRGGGAGDAGASRRAAARHGAARRLGPGSDGVRVPRLGPGARGGGWAGRARRGCLRQPRPGRAHLPGHAVPLGRDDRAGHRLLGPRPHGVSPPRQARPSRRRPAGGGRGWRRRAAPGRPQHLRRSGRPHRVLARRRADPAFHGTRERNRRRGGNRARVSARAAAQARSTVITWATSDGREEGGDRVVPAASTIKLFVASAFWRSRLDPTEPVEPLAVPWSVADELSSVTLGDCALLAVAFSDNAATNVLLERLGFSAVNEEARRLGCERTEVRRLMLTDGPENVTCARDLARGLAALDDERVLDALARAHDSELPLLLDERDVRVKTGELWPRVYHEVALVDLVLGVAVCSSPAVRPGEAATLAASLVEVNSS